jgi:peptide/nickel transport system permease protein
MVVFALRRLTQTAAVLAVACVLAFAMAKNAGDPVAQMLGNSATTQDQADLRHRLGLDRPAVEQMWRYASSMATGDFGISYQYGRPVLALVAERIPATAELSIVAGVLSLLVALPLGMFAAQKPDTFAARAGMAFASIGVSLPTFMLGTLAVIFLAGRWRLFPSFGRGEVIDLGFWSTGLLTASGWRSITLPACTLALFQAATVAKIVRAEALAAYAAPHIVAARARGLPEGVVRRHVARTITVPVATVTAVQFGIIVAYAIVTESVFQWPGLGSLLIGAVRSADVPVLAAYVVLAAGFFTAMSFLVDVLQIRLDPRVRDAAETMP